MLQVESARFGCLFELEKKKKIRGAKSFSCSAKQKHQQGETLNK
jgi:hypothetical protein